MLYRRLLNPLLLALVVVALLAPASALAEPAAPPVAPEIIAALKGLKKASSDDRQKTYDLIADKGDAQLIPALDAYKDGSLLLSDGQLLLYAKRITLADGTTVFPLVDAISGAPAKGADGQPIQKTKIDLSDAIRAPRAREKSLVIALISSLSLMSPDPAVRVASIRDVGETAGRAFIDQPDQTRMLDALKTCSTILKEKAKHAAPALAAALTQNATELDAAIAEHPSTLAAITPDEKTTRQLESSLKKTQAMILPPPAGTATAPADPELANALADGLTAIAGVKDRTAAQAKVLDDLPHVAAALKRQLDKDPNSKFAGSLKESLAEVNLAIGDNATQLQAAKDLGSFGTARAAVSLRKAVDAAHRTGNTELAKTAQTSLDAANSYQTRIHFIQNTFAGLSASSILILLALGLSIVFGLMGVINMAHGEFMMIGAFTTYVVSEFFKAHMSAGAYDYYPIVAVPAALLVSGFLGYVTESLVIRHLYGRPLDSLLATWGIGLIFIWAVRWKFGDNLSVRPPSWMEGGVEVAPDLIFPFNRIYIICFCAICIAAVYFLVNKTKLGLLLRATTQNREMAAALGIATRRVDGLTFALGTGLAGLAGVVVPMYNKINPSIGQEYVVDSFMVVVTGGVGKLAGVIWAGLGLGFVGKYLEAFLNLFPSMTSSSSVIGKVFVLLLIIAFLQKRPSGLFPPKGRMAD